MPILLSLSLLVVRDADSALSEEREKGPPSFLALSSGKMAPLLLLLLLLLLSSAVYGIL